MWHRPPCSKPSRPRWRARGSGGFASKRSRQVCWQCRPPTYLGGNPLSFQSVRASHGLADAPCWQSGPSDLPASAPDRFASKSNRATCEQAALRDLQQTPRSGSGKFAANFSASTANDFPGTTTISRFRQRSIDGTSHQTTIARVRATLANARGQSARKKQRKSNALPPLKRNTIFCKRTPCALLSRQGSTE